MYFGDPHVIDGETDSQSQKVCVCVMSLLACLPPGPYQHLPAGHEVGALADPLKDALQLGADEAVVLGDSGKRPGEGGVTKGSVLSPLNQGL